MKTTQKQYLKKIITVSILSISLNLSVNAFAYTNNYCKKIPKSYGKKLAQSFKQNPAIFLEQLIEASSKELENSERQNKLISASFDLKSVYKANTKYFKSKIITNSLFDWVRTQYFGNLNSNYIKKNDFLLRKNYDLLTESERINMQTFKPKWTAVERKKCSKKEQVLLGCKKNLFKMTMQFVPEVSCKDKDLQKAFEADFFLTYSPKYGFKVLDLKLSGKRLVLDSLDMMLSLKKDGFNKNAIARQLDVLSLGEKTFRLPRKQIHSGRFLANFNRGGSEERVPASL